MCRYPARKSVQSKAAHSSNLPWSPHRLIAPILAAFLLSGPVATQEWEEYSYPGYAFTMFPADPNIETTAFEVARGRSAPARVYSVRQDRVTMTVVDLANTGLQERTSSTTRSRHCRQVAK
jgi:hypothetical protein